MPIHSAPTLPADYGNASGYPGCDMVTVARSESASVPAYERNTVNPNSGKRKAARIANVKLTPEAKAARRACRSGMTVIHVSPDTLKRSIRAKGDSSATVKLALQGKRGTVVRLNGRKTKSA
jgi:hypothetical protein